MTDSVEIVRCPLCRSRDVRPSYPNGLRDTIMATFGFTPLRCRSCRKRFYRRTVSKGENPEKEQSDSAAAGHSPD